MSQPKSSNTLSETPKEKIKKTASARKTQLFFGLLFVCALVLGLVRWSPHSRTTIHTPKGTLSALLADTDALREKGLSGRQSLSRDQAMLFVFEKDSQYGFWMKDMKFPIDIVWLDKNKTVVTVVARALPESYPMVYYPTKPSRYVIEVAENRAAELGIVEGSTLQW